MGFPLRHGEILPGADASNLKVQYRGTDRRADLFREFRRGLGQAFGVPDNRQAIAGERNLSARLSGGRG